MAVAFAFKIKEIEDDVSLVAGTTKECFECDPYNPHAVPREKCGSCGGTGKQVIAAGQIAEELSAAKCEGDAAATKKSDGGSSDDEDLLLEY